MKKVYICPNTDAIQMTGTSNLLNGSGTPGMNRTDSGPQGEARIPARKLYL